MALSLLFVAAAFSPVTTRGHGFVSHNVRLSTSPTMGFLDGFFQELDNFIDDAANRRLGNGAKFYGKRRSSFYGEEDPNRKRDPNVFDPEEDWRGPAGGSYFVPSKERDEQGRPLGFLTKKEARAAAAEEEKLKWKSARQSQSLMDSFASAVDDAEGEREELKR
jgi:hypothetical protein